MLGGTSPSDGCAGYEGPPLPTARGLSASWRSTSAWSSATTLCGRPRAPPGPHAPCARQGCNRRRTRPRPRCRCRAAGTPCPMAPGRVASRESAPGAVRRRRHRPAPAAPLEAEGAPRPGWPPEGPTSSAASPQQRPPPGKLKNRSGFAWSGQAAPGSSTVAAAPSIRRHQWPEPSRRWSPWKAVGLSPCTGNCSQSLRTKARAVSLALR